MANFNIAFGSSVALSSNGSLGVWAPWESAFYVYEHAL